MRHKFTILQDTDKDTFIIREYAVVEKHLKKMLTLMPSEDDFSLMAEETYAGKNLSKLISRGAVAELVTSLRTDNLFPINPYATKIAESIIAMHASAECRFMELFFDDQTP
ncbi:hypothetical protein [Desulfococcus multivorans]|uniref:Uncharacterized protein n=1 Tax=Desulfococcus multivorans DSM 2059 TaxID=1121405 RepID=S7TLM5_DESML|nr:hypothetical protein [Desulfococcus multivorans]AOY58283.1 uncharacterized protein Dmul_15080 [Desulfococcus multivorans]AQV00624.1 hypothetical protein B2D07_07460 [Desulfococcus multivorans]EPR37776.1 hypothetical protein dsmv_2987 [Desulfococcus multivorans DSM 2059]SJZ98071.1 hypothetical protein SAMN02745446_02308 [Desulfococcus multivorans DSM 2059]